MAERIVTMKNNTFSEFVNFIFMSYEGLNDKKYELNVINISKKKSYPAKNLVCGQLILLHSRWDICTRSLALLKKTFHFSKTFLHLRHEIQIEHSGRLVAFFSRELNNNRYGILIDTVRLAVQLQQAFFNYPSSAGGACGQDETIFTKYEI